MMAEDAKISEVLEKIFVDILRKFFELDILDVRSLDATEKIQTLVSLWNHIRDRIQTSGNTIKIPIQQILEFMIIEEFSVNIHLNKVIQLYMQEMIYELLKNALLQNTFNKVANFGLLFQAMLWDNITQSFQNRLFGLFIYCVPNVAKEMRENLVKVGFPQIMNQPNFMQKLIDLSINLLDYYNFIDSKAELKSRVAKFKEEIGSKDKDPSNHKYNLHKLNLNDTYKYLQLNLLDLLNALFALNEKQPDMQDDEESKDKDKISQESERITYPEYSHRVIPILMLSTASVINEVNEKAREILKVYEKYSDINQVSVWSEAMKYYIGISKKSVKNNLARFEVPVQKTILLYARNLKRNVLEYALKWEVTAKLPQLLTAINDQGQIRLLGLKFVDHMIKYLGTYNNKQISQVNSRTVYTLLNKILSKKGFLDNKERSLAYRSLVDVIVKIPDLLQLDKKDPMQLVDEWFNEFKQWTETIGSKNDEIYANWIKWLDKLKMLFSNSASKDSIIAKMKEQIETVINNFGIDDDKHTIFVYICLNWLEYLCNKDDIRYDLMYISVILSYANDLKISSVAKHILTPLLDNLKAQKAKVDKQNEEIKEDEDAKMDVDSESYITSMFIK